MSRNECIWKMWTTPCYSIDFPMYIIFLISVMQMGDKNMCIFFFKHCCWFHSNKTLIIFQSCNPSKAINRMEIFRILWTWAQFPCFFFLSEDDKKVWIIYHFSHILQCISVSTTSYHGIVTEMQIYNAVNNNVQNQK